MKKAYLLTFYKTEADLRNDTDGFFIGVFSTLEKCMEIQSEYSEKIEGFRDCPDGVWKAVDKELKGFASDFSPVSEETVLYFITAWNETEQGDTRDLIYSDFYPSQEMASGFMSVLRNDFPRKNWEISEYTLDEAWWREGFLMAETLQVAVNRVVDDWFFLTFMNLDGAITVHNSKKNGNDAPTNFMNAVKELSDHENFAKVLRFEEETHSWILILQKTGSAFDLEIYAGGCKYPYVFQGETVLEDRTELIFKASTDFSSFKANVLTAFESYLRSDEKEAHNYKISWKSVKQLRN